MQDAFFLAYGGLHWSYTGIRQLPVRRRAEFVDALECQLAHERAQLARR